MLLLTPLLLLLGCPEPEPTHYEYRLYLDLNVPHWYPVEGLPLYMGEEQIGVLPRSGEAELTLPAQTFLTEPDVSLSVQAPTSAGPTRLPLVIDGDRHSEESGRERPGPVRLKVSLGQAMRQLVVYLDNRHGEAATTVAVGAQEIAVPAGGVHRQPVPLTGEQVPAIRVGQQALPEVSMPGAEQALLIDLTGGHCYAAEDLLYADPALIANGLVAPEGKARLYTGGQVQPVELVTFLFEPPPEKISTGTDVASQSVLYEIPCP